MKSAEILTHFAASTSYRLEPSHASSARALTFNSRFLTSNYALSGSPRRFPAERFAPGHVVSGKYDCAGKQFSICSAAIGPICIAFAIRYADKRRIIIGRRHLGLATMCVSGALSVTDLDSFIPRGFPIGDSKKTTRVWENAWLPSDRLRRADFPVNLLYGTSARKSTVEPWPDLSIDSTLESNYAIQWTCCNGSFSLISRI